MKDNKLKLENYFLISTIIIALLILASPLFLRIMQGNNLLIGEASHYHARMAHNILEEKRVYFFDDKIEGGRNYIISPYHATIAAMALITGVETASKIIPILLGIGSAILFSLLLRYFGMMLEKRIFVLALLALTPAFVATFSVSGIHSAAIFMILLAVYTGLMQGFRWKTISLALFILAASLSMFHALLIAAILILYFISDIKRHVAALWGTFAVVLFIVLYSPEQKYASEGLIRGTLSDLGASQGLGVFNVMLAAIGILYLWRRKLHYFFIFSTLLFLIFGIAFFGNLVNPYLAFIIAIFSCYGLVFFTERHWELPFIKNLAIAILILGLAISQLSFINRLAESAPQQDTVKAAMFLKEQPPGTVLSHYSNGFWIEYFADKPVLEDELTRNSISSQLFSSRNLQTTKHTLDNYSIRYIWIDPEMKQGEVWNNPEEGLLFLFRNNETFRKIYDERIEIWQVITTSP